MGRDGDTSRRKTFGAGHFISKMSGIDSEEDHAKENITPWQSFVAETAMVFGRPPQVRPGPLGRFVSGSRFEATVSATIMLNVFFIGFSANYHFQNTERAQAAEDELLPIEVFFACFYLIELILRIIVYRLSYIFSTDWAFNCCDCFLVIVGLQEVALAFTQLLSPTR